MAIHVRRSPRATGKPPDYDDSQWQEGPAGFGTGNTGSRRAAPSGTRATSGSDALSKSRATVPIEWHCAFIMMKMCEVFLNGVRVLGVVAIPPTMKPKKSAQSVEPGSNVIAIHCHQTSGGQYIDVGIDAIVPAEADRGVNELPK